MRICAFAASRTGVSIIPFASFAAVLPVHGYISITSNIFSGPTRSACCNVFIPSSPVIFFISPINSPAFPNLVFNICALYEYTGTTFLHFAVSVLAVSVALPKLQKDPVIPIPTVQSPISIEHPPYLFFLNTPEKFRHWFLDNIFRGAQVHAHNLFYISSLPQNHSLPVLMQYLS